MDFTIRECKKEDLPEALDLIRELAIYEKAPEEVDLTLEQFEKDGFGETPLFGMYVAVQSNKIEGIAVEWQMAGITLNIADILGQITWNFSYI